MKIALFNSLYPPLGIGGSEMSTMYLAKGLVGRGHSVQVISENTQDLLQRESIDGIDVVRLPNPDGFGPNVMDDTYISRLQSRQRKTNASVDQRLNEALPDFGPDIVHTNVIGGTSSIWALARRQMIPAVHTLRSYSLICSKRMLLRSGPCVRQCRDCAAPNGRRIGRDRSSMIQGIVGIGSHVLKVHREAGWFADVSLSAIIPNSYDVEPTSVEGDEAMPPKGYDFGFIGRIHHTKGVELFLDAVRDLQRVNGRQIAVLVSGTGNETYVQKVKTEYSDLNVHFSGYIAAATFFSATRFCVVPSVWYEPFGRIFIEALANGVPLLASIRGGGSEIIDSDCGFFIDPSDPSTITSAMASALDMPDLNYKRMCRAALDRSKIYSVERIADRYISFYEKAKESIESETKT